MKQNLFINAFIGIILALFFFSLHPEEFFADYKISLHREITKNETRDYFYWDLDADGTAEIISFWHDKLNTSLNIGRPGQFIDVYNLSNGVTFISKQYGVTDFDLDAKSEIVSRILINLLTNATKYSPVNSPIRLCARVINNDFVRFEIQDSGIGIPRDKLHLIFEKFEQINAKALGFTQSTGLGLSFCKMAVNAHGGQIGVESEIGQGSIFWFTLKKSNDLENEIETSVRLGTEKKHEFTMDMFLGNEHFLKELQKVRLYEISKIRKMIHSISSDNKEPLSLWKNEVLIAANSGNNCRFKELVYIDNDQ